MKAASNLALPLAGIGLMYREGYFRQYLNQDGWQQEKYPQTDIYNLPVERIKDSAGNDLTISIQGPDGPIHAIVWKIMVGRIPLFLLDTNIAENTPPRGKSPRDCMPATPKFVWPRKCCWESAG